MKVSVINHKWWLNAVLVALSALNATCSWAACNFPNDSPPPSQVIINVPASLVIPRDAAIGSEVYRTDVATSNIGDFQCSVTYGGYTSNWGTSSTGPSPLGESGLAWRFFLNDVALLPYATERYFYGSLYAFRLRKGSFRLYKVAESTSEVSAGNIGRYIVDSTVLINFVISNTIKPIVSSCTTPSITVPLGKQYSNKFKGVGSVIGERAFSIKLNNCPAGINSISYRLDPVNSALDAVNGILALDPGGATGVGIKITDDNNAAVGLGVSREFLKSVAEGSYAIPLKAAYYKTSDTVVGGAANASMQFTITYQ